MISLDQHRANRENAQRSTGPKTPEGKEAVRFNALKHGLRARSTLLPCENPDEFNELCAALEDDWQPQTETERLHVEQLAVHQWLMRRLAIFECCLYEKVLPGPLPMDLLERFSVQRTRLENSFSKTIRDLEHLQHHRPARAEKEAAETKPHSPAPDPWPPQPEEAPPSPDAGHVYVMAPDTR